MFTTEKSAKRALIALMTFFLVGMFFVYLDAKYNLLCLFLGLELILFWSYLNPWIMQVKYSPIIFLDYDKVKHSEIVIIGGIVVFGSFFM